MRLDVDRFGKQLRKHGLVWKADLAAFLHRQRRSSKDRFHRPGDGSRIIFLGALLVIFGALALLDVARPGAIPDGFSGGSAIFGGAAVSFFVTKIARTSIYPDWLLSGASYSVAGMILAADQSLSQVSSLLGFLTSIAAAGGLRVWIGATASPERGAAWFSTAGVFCLLSASWVLLVWLVGPPPSNFGLSASPALVLSLDTIALGVSMAGFGSSIKERT